jgi:LysM repeat protein
MKVRQLMLLGMVALLAIIMSHLTTPSTSAQTGPNLLTNPGFEEGHYNQGGIAEITVPNGWRLYWLDGVEFAGSNGVAYRPESVVWHIEGAPPHERDLYWRDGIYTLKVFKSWAPMYATLAQDVAGLEVGRQYRLAVPIFIDIIADYEEGKIAPTKMDSGMVRLGASPVGATWRDGNAIKYSGWWTAETISPFYLAQPIFLYDFTATHETMTVWVEFASKDPYPNNGFFLDGLSLRALDAAPVAPAPPPTTGTGQQQPAAPAAPLPPAPTIEPRADGSIIHTVQSNDTLWGLAIRYASSLDMTAEQALNHINTLNNSPAFLNIGQELIIRPAGSTPAAEEPEATDEAEETEALAEAEEDGDDADEADVEAEEAEVTMAAATEGNAICVLAFHDQNANGEQEANDPILADAALTLTRGGSTVATAVSDGTGDGHCFDGLESGTYMVQFYPPADYVPTTAPSWAVAVSDGSRIAVKFGAQRGTAVAAVDSDAQAESVVEAETDTLAVEAVMVVDDGGGLLANLGTIVIAIAVFLILLAGAGIFLLRRG